MRNVQLINPCCPALESRMCQQKHSWCHIWTNKDFCFLKGLRAEPKQPLPRPRGQTVLLALRHHSLRPALPVAQPCLCPPAPRHPNLLRTLRLPPLARGRRLPSRSGYLRAADLPVRSAFRSVGCWARVPRARRAAPLPRTDVPNAGWRLPTMYPWAARV